ncbi:NADH dehydrogenase subunit I [Limihaloglobus sulfuriphilus]|uniref:NADH dehydrogenase subunit I n=1 Tax=Limihaloglobus sulfuriphilus TaxID=1851148 RepID=A0A1Q2MGM1_9BACT|nr:ATP-binding protein [Limihaloglobus sulfuriphilus]AQQ71799.1 NADH dehydrogenase subunit I [Limihaloglobus sulfuriphilus]
MKELVVISGKGGTGKTSITAAFASLAQDFVLADCDVDAADLHLVMNPKINNKQDFSGGRQAVIKAGECIGCGVCFDMCRFGAISLNGPANETINKTYTVDPVSCEGCNVCVEFCPVGAIEFKDAINGQWFISETRFGPMVHAKLGIAQENSGKLVTLIRKEAKRIAEEQIKNLLIVDGSPGIGCPVIASIAGADLVLVVTEPTLSGIHDLDRVMQLTSNFGIKTLVCINKADINLEMTERIEEESQAKGTKVIGKIPYDESFTKAQIMRATLIEYTGGEIAEKVKSMYREIIYALG